MDYLDQLVQILSGIWNVLTWILQTEERVALYMHREEVLLGNRILILCLINSMGVIPIDYSIIHACWRFFPRVRRISTPRIAKLLVRGKRVTLWDLALFAFVPAGTQKVGVLALHAKRHEFGWRGYLFLAMGGCARVSLYPLLGKWLWAIVVAVIVLRGLELWWNHNNGSSET